MLRAYTVKNLRKIIDTRVSKINLVTLVQWISVLIKSAVSHYEPITFRKNSTVRLSFAREVTLFRKFYYTKIKNDL